MASIKTNILYSSILTTANYIFPLITYPYVSRVLGVTNIGICNFVDSIINYFSMFSLMGIVAVGIRNVAAAKNDRNELSKTLTNLFWINTVSTLIVVAALCLSIFLVPKFQEHKELMFVGVLKVIFSYLMIDWFYRGIEDFKYITNCGLIIRLGYVVGIFAFVRGKDDYDIYYLLSVMMIVVNAIMNLWHSRKFASISLNLKQVEIRKYLPSFLTLGLYIILTSMYTTFNVAYLGFACDETEVGYYTTATKLHTIFLSIFSAFTGVMLPRMSSLISEGNNEDFKIMITKSIRILIAFSLPLIAFTEVFADDIIMLISGPDYELAITPMQIVMPLILIIGYEQIIVIQVLMPLKKDRAIFIGSLAGAAAGIITNILVVGELRSIGSAIVWFSSEIVVLTVSQYFTNKSIKIGFPAKACYRYIAAAVPCAALLYGVKCIAGGYLSAVLLGIITTAAYSIAMYVFILKDDIAVGLFHVITDKIQRRK